MTLVALQSDSSAFRTPRPGRPDAPAQATSAGDRIETGLFWAMIAGLAWCPFWFGSNTLGAWGINAVLFSGRFVS